VISVLRAASGSLPTRLVVADDGTQPTVELVPALPNPRTSPSPVVPLQCHSQRSWPVPSGQPRTLDGTAHLHSNLDPGVQVRPAYIPLFPGSGTALRSKFHTGCRNGPGARSRL
jgi:hypothetical protein